MRQHPGPETARSPRVTQPENHEAHVLWDADDIDRAVTRIAHQIIEENRGTGALMLLGIPTRGVPLAERLARIITEATGNETPTGQLDITMYRDDLRHNPTRAVGKTRIPGGTVDGAHIFLIDDVLYSGRTIAAALEALTDLGRPDCVKLAVLVDRGRREFPIQATIVGKTIPTSADERVHVQMVEIDGVDNVTISRR